MGCRRTPFCLSSVLERGGGIYQQCEMLNVEEEGEKDCDNNNERR